MNVILNDYSLDNQFLNIDDFINSIKETTIPLFIFLENLSKERGHNYELLKSYKSFNCEIFQKQTLNDLFKYKTSKSAIQKLLVSLTFCKRPYWEDDQKTKLEDSILIDDITEIPNCITEAFYRNICLISFDKSKYCDKSIGFQINKKKVVSINSISKEQFIEALPICYGIKIKEGHDIKYDNKSVFLEVRDKENGEHKSAHFHLTEKEGKNRSVSIQIDSSFTYLAGKKDLRLEWLEWCKNNYFYIKEMWNYRHPERLIEDKT